MVLRQPGATSNVCKGSMKKELKDIALEIFFGLYFKVNSLRNGMDSSGGKRFGRPLY